MNAKPPLFRSAAVILIFLSTAISIEARALPTRAQGLLDATPYPRNFDSLLSPDSPCALPAPEAPITLSDALRYSLCGNPRTRQAWAALEAQNARLEQAKSAYWPTLNGTLQYDREHTGTIVRDTQQLRSDQLSHFQSQALTLSWEIFDFGVRAAATDSANQLLISYKFRLDDAVQHAFFYTAKDYYSAIAARAALQSARKNEQIARKILDIARARVARGVAAISDQLQANTALAQAAYKRAQAAGRWRTYLGALAIDMGLDPRTKSLRLATTEQNLGKTGDTSSLPGLLNKAEQLNPNINAARAQHLAAMAEIDVAQKKYFPTVNLNWTYSHNTQPSSPGLGLNSLPSETMNNTISIKINIPLFDGFNRAWKVQEAQDQATQEAASLDDTRRQVIRNVWSAYEQYRSSIAEFQDSHVVENTALSALSAAKKRYQKGVASIQELLSAQSSLANSRVQATQALTDCLFDRLQLAYAVGTLGQTIDLGTGK